MQDESTELQSVPTSALATVDHEEIDIQIATAKRYPRDVAKSIKRMEDMACMSKEVAESCFYAYERGGKLIEGPSVRLAEIALSCWGNIRSKSRILEEGKKDIAVECMTWDVQENIAVSQPCKRRIVDRNNMKYTTDMILQTSLAAVSIAFRNSTFRVIPRPLIDEIYRKARQVAFGDVKAIALSRAKAVETFGKLGVSPERIFAALEDVEKLEDIGAKELSTLRGALSAIKEGSLTIEKAFPPVPSADEKGGESASTSPPSSRTEAMKSRLRDKEKEKPPESKPETQEPEASKAPEPEPARDPAKKDDPEPVAAVVNVAIRRGVDKKLLGEWLSELNIREGDLRSQTVKRLAALETKIDDWLESQEPSEGQQDLISDPPEEEPAQNQHSHESGVQALLQRIESVMGFSGDPALDWIGETLGSFLNSIEDLTPEHLASLNEVLDLAEQEGS